MAKLAIPTEWQEQVMLCRWLDAHRIVFYAVPNGGSRKNAYEGHRLKQAGLKAGVPDIVIPVTTLSGARFCPGVVIELKRRKGGKLTAQQRAWLDYFKSQSWLALVANGADEAISKLQEWGFGERRLGVVG